jgi:hypothetical protein
LAILGLVVVVALPKRRGLPSLDETAGERPPRGLGKGRRISVRIPMSSIFCDSFHGHRPLITKDQIRDRIDKYNSGSESLLECSPSSQPASEQRMPEISDQGDFGPPPHQQ